MSIDSIFAALESAIRWVFEMIEKVFKLFETPAEDTESAEK